MQVMPLQSVVELPEFLRQAKAVMSDIEREELLLFLAGNPGAGQPLGGGLRKVRFARPGGGKSGGFRTIYVFGGARLPLFLVSVFAKNDKGNLTRRELAAAVELSKRLIAEYGA